MCKEIKGELKLMKKEDMRTIRTRKSLRKALYNLMEKETVEKISVTDICNEGDIVTVKVIDIDNSGKIRLSRKAALKEM